MWSAVLPHICKFERSVRVHWLFSLYDMLNEGNRMKHLCKWRKTLNRYADRISRIVFFFSFTSSFLVSALGPLRLFIPVIPSLPNSVILVYSGNSRTQARRCFFQWSMRTWPTSEIGQLLGSLTSDTVYSKTMPLFIGSKRGCNVFLNVAWKTFTFLFWNFFLGKTSLCEYYIDLVKAKSQECWNSQLAKSFALWSIS